MLEILVVVQAATLAHGVRLVRKNLVENQIVYYNLNAKIV